MHVNLGGYHIRDIEFSAAFDIDANKVGQGSERGDLPGAEQHHQVLRRCRTSACRSSRGMTHDGLGKYLSAGDHQGARPDRRHRAHPAETKTDVVVNYLPVGSEMATKWYVEQMLEAGCGFVNCIPVFIGREEYWQKRFKDRNLPIIGDDIKSQVGATITHRVLTRLFAGPRRASWTAPTSSTSAATPTSTTCWSATRLESKKISKTNAVTSQLDYDLEPDNVHVGPSDYVPWLTDRKWAYIRMEGTLFGDVPLNIELKLEVWDSPNSAGVVIDAVRCAKLALDRGIGGALEGPSAYFMKSPPVQYHDDVARELVEAFIRDEEPSVPTRTQHRAASATATARSTYRLAMARRAESRTIGESDA